MTGYSDSDWRQTCVAISNVMADYHAIFSTADELLQSNSGACWIPREHESFVRLGVNTRDFQRSSFGQGEGFVDTDVAARDGAEPRPTDQAGDVEGEQGSVGYDGSTRSTIASMACSLRNRDAWGRETKFH